MASIMGKTEEIWCVAVERLFGGGGMVEHEMGTDFREPFGTVSMDILTTPEKIDDRLIVPRPFGMCPRPFAIACCDIIHTALIRYTTICVFY